MLIWNRLRINSHEFASRASAISKIDATESSVCLWNAERHETPFPPKKKTSSPTAPKNGILVWSWFKIHSKIRLGFCFRGERSKLPKVVTGNLGINYRLNRNGARQWFLKPRFQGFVVGIIPMWNWTTNKIDRSRKMLLLFISLRLRKGRYTLPFLARQTLLLGEEVGLEAHNNKKKSAQPFDGKKCWHLTLPQFREQ